MARDQWAKARKILCVRLDNLGDVLMTTPAFRALKALNPNVHLTLLTSRMGSGIARFVPEIDAVIEFDVPWVKVEGQLLNSQSVFDLIARLKQEHFDAAVIFTVFSQNPLPAALICYLAEIPLRLGYCRENPYDLLTDWVPDTEPLSDIQHEVIRQLNLVKTIGVETDNTALSLNVPVHLRDQALEQLRSLMIDPRRRWLLLHRGVSEKKRQYPPELFAEAGRALVRLGYQIGLTGVASEKALTDQLAKAIGAGGVSLAGQFSLGDFIGLIASAPLLIANNTGPVHIAAAVGTPVVVLYAHTNPQHTPWNVPNRVLYFDVPEYLRSRNVLLAYTYARTVQQPVNDAQPADIVQAVQDLLRDPRPRV
ncbi:MAG: glycosyltransferase family 9 protein [Anaerolineae bacterium]|nr:glycosyltransferase family 9 protein [Anaerolineae bacterium]